MWYVGLDVHAKLTAVCILDENGKKFKSFIIKAPIASVPSILAKLEKPFAVVYEASSGYGWLYDHLVAIGQTVRVAHPGKLRLIFRSKRKNDRLDAEKLAKLLYLDAVPQVHVPAGEVRSWRRMIRHRHRIVAQRTRAKNGLRSLLRTHAIVAPKGLWNRQGMAWLEGLALEDSGDAVRRDMLLADLRHCQQQLRRVEKLLDEIAARHPGVLVLRTIPGVGPRTSEAVVAYIDRPERFGRSKSVAAYFGVIPCEDTSAGPARFGHITREGPGVVRKLLTEAAWQAIRRSPKVRKHYERIRRNDKDRKKIAIVATAHYLLRVMQAMLLSGEAWRETAA